MTDTIPEWALTRANEAIGPRPDDFPPLYWLDARDASALALVALDAETAERVERETIERCADIAKEPRLWPSSLSLYSVAKIIDSAIRSLPAKYGAKT